MLTDEGVEGGGLLDLGEGLVEVGEASGVVHEGVDAVFELDGEGVVWGDEVVLEVLGVEGVAFVGEGFGCVFGGVICGEGVLEFLVLGEEEGVTFVFVVFYDHGTLYLGEVPPPSDVFVGDAFVS